MTLLALAPVSARAAVGSASDSGSGEKSARAKAKKGQILIVSGRDGRILKKLNGAQKKDEYGGGLGFDGLPMTGGLSAMAVGAPGADEGAGRIFAVATAEGTKLWSISGADLTGGPVGRLGQSFQTLGHINGDTPVHWAIGAPASGEARGTDGAVVIMHAPSNVLIERLRLEGSALSRLGWAVTASDDASGDSIIDHFVASAPGQANGGKNAAGALHRVSSLDGSRGWTLLGKKKNQYLGYAMTFAPDENGDGVRDLTVGAPGDARTAGVVLLVSNASGRVIHEFKAPRGAGSFGFSVARVDIDGDSVPEVIVGAPATDGVAGEHVGAVFAYSGADRSLIWSREGEAAGQWFGSAVDNALDLDGDGLSDLLVGSLVREDPKPKKSMRGAVQAISPATDRVLFTIRGKRGNDLVGLPIHGPFFDFNGDGTSDLLVGSPRIEEPFLPE